LNRFAAGNLWLLVGLILLLGRKHASYAPDVYVFFDASGGFAAWFYNALILGAFALGALFLTLSRGEK
jgi:hypothetical protein